MKTYAATLTVKVNYSRSNNAIMYSKEAIIEEIPPTVEPERCTLPDYFDKFNFTRYETFKDVDDTYCLSYEDMDELWQYVQQQGRARQRKRRFMMR